MPYHIGKVKGGYQVVSTDTGKTHSNKPMPKGRAARQLKALYANVKDAGGGRG
jgi:hypothetical protein